MRQEIFGTPDSTVDGRWRPSRRFPFPSDEEHFEACRKLGKLLDDRFGSDLPLQSRPFSVYFDFFDWSDRTIYLTPNCMHPEALNIEFLQAIQNWLASDGLRSWRVYVECGSDDTRGIIVYPEVFRWDQRSGRCLQEAVASGQEVMRTCSMDDYEEDRSAGGGLTQEQIEMFFREADERMKEQE